MSRRFRYEAFFVFALTILIYCALFYYPPYDAPFFLSPITMQLGILYGTIACVLYQKKEEGRAAKFVIRFFAAIALFMADTLRTSFE